MEDKLVVIIMLLVCILGVAIGTTIGLAYKVRECEYHLSVIEQVITLQYQDSKKTEK